MVAAIFLLIMFVPCWLGIRLGGSPETFAGLAGLTAYAYLGDMAPTREEVRQPVELNVGG